MFGVDSSKQKKKKEDVKQNNKETSELKKKIKDLEVNKKELAKQIEKQQKINRETSSSPQENSKSVKELKAKLKSTQEKEKKNRAELSKKIKSSQESYNKKIKSLKKEALRQQKKGRNQAQKYRKYASEKKSLAEKYARDRKAKESKAAQYKQYAEQKSQAAKKERERAEQYKKAYLKQAKLGTKGKSRTSGTSSTLETSGNSKNSGTSGNSGEQGNSSEQVNSSEQGTSPTLGEQGTSSEQNNNSNNNDVPNIEDLTVGDTLTVTIPQVKDTENNVIDFKQNEKVTLLSAPTTFEHAFEVEKLDGTKGYVFKGHIDKKYGKCKIQYFKATEEQNKLNINDSLIVKTPQVKYGAFINFNQNETVTLLSDPTEFELFFKVKKIDGTIGYIYKGHIHEKYGECLMQYLLSPNIIRANDATNEYNSNEDVSDTDIDSHVVIIKSIIEKLREKDIRLLVFDFDLTITKEHMHNGKFKYDAADILNDKTFDISRYLHKILHKPDEFYITEFIKQIHENNKSYELNPIIFSIASYGEQSKIMATLNKALSEGEGENIDLYIKQHFISGREQAFVLTPNLQINTRTTNDNTRIGKNPQIIDLIQMYNTTDGYDRIENKNVLYIDDDSENIQAANDDNDKLQDIQTILFNRKKNDLGFSEIGFDKEKLEYINTFLDLLSEPISQEEPITLPDPDPEILDLNLLSTFSNIYIDIEFLSDSSFTTKEEILRKFKEIEKDNNTIFLFKDDKIYNFDDLEDNLTIQEDATSILDSQDSEKVQKEHNNLFIHYSSLNENLFKKIENYNQNQNIIITNNLIEDICDLKIEAKKNILFSEHDIGDNDFSYYDGDNSSKLLNKHSENEFFFDNISYTNSKISRTYATKLLVDSNLLNEDYQTKLDEQKYEGNYLVLPKNKDKFLLTVVYKGKPFNFLIIKEYGKFKLKVGTGLIQFEGDTLAQLIQKLKTKQLGWLAPLTNHPNKYLQYT